MKAFAPGNLSCIFVICPDKDPSKMGSLGVGIGVDKGAVVSVKKSNKTEIFVDRKRAKFPTVQYVIDKLASGGVKVKIKHQLPYGCGFGISGASAFACAYALNKLFRLGKSKKELAMVAHMAEVENKTGLGDVAGQYTGGVCVKYKKGSPLEAERLNIKNKFVYYKVFGALDTKKVITNSKITRNINKAGLLALKKVKSAKNLGDIVKISREFATNSDLIKDNRVKNLIEKLGNASMVMLGNAVFSDKAFKGSKRLRIL